MKGYEYIIEEKCPTRNGTYWLEKYTSHDRKCVNAILKVLKAKYPNESYRVVRWVP